MTPETRGSKPMTEYDDTFTHTEWVQALARGYERAENKASYADSHKPHAETIYKAVAAKYKAAVALAADAFRTYAAICGAHVSGHASDAELETSAHTYHNAVRAFSMAESEIAWFRGYLKPVYPDLDAAYLKVGG